MKSRRPLAKKTRFEIFKRDGFKCQYCGASAPDAALRVDHINPVANGGTDDPLNLITACFDCNAGKSDRHLSDDAIASKSIAQAQALQLRREQIKMMAEWHMSLEDSRQDEVGAFGALFQKLSGWAISDSGEGMARKWIKRFGLAAVLEATTIAISYYGRTGGDHGISQDTANVAFDKIPGVCRMAEINNENPQLREIYYVRGILRNKFPYQAEKITRFAIPECRDAVARGWSIAALKRVAASSCSWNNFSNVISGPAQAQ